MKLVSVCKCLVVALIFATVARAQSNELVADTPRYATANGEPRANWISSAKDMMAGPAGQMVVSVAKELISRSAGNSQVLSLNLTNLLVLVLLKAIIFAAGLIGAGSWGHYGRGRSEPNNVSLFEDGEAPLFLGFLAAQGSGQDGCLHRAACRTPKTAAEYSRAARAILKGSEILSSSLPYNDRYNQLVQTIERAAMEGMEGAPCEMIYACRV